MERHLGNLDFALLRRLVIFRTITALVLLVLTAAAASATPVVVTTSVGSNAGQIQSIVDGFRASLGALNPNTPGSAGSGRREINWDGVPDALSAPNNLPANFFNVNSPRGTVFESSQNQFQVSGDDDTGADADPDQLRFDNIDSSYSSTFGVFSNQRLFTALGTNEMDVRFFIPGTTQAALTNGFGTVFTDVDLAGSTSIQYFDSLDNLILTVTAEAMLGSKTLSFAGAVFAEAIISRVHIISGNAALAHGVRDWGRIDLVAMDDFIYGEPVAVPEPSSMILFGSAAVSVLRRRKVLAAG